MSKYVASLLLGAVPSSTTPTMSCSQRRNQRETLLMMQINGRLTPNVRRVNSYTTEKLSTAFWCLIRVSASILLISFTMLHFITRNNSGQLWISWVRVWITWKRIHVCISRIPSALNVHSLRGTFLSYPFWECRGEWGRGCRCRYTCMSLRHTSVNHSYPATTGEWTHRIIGRAKRCMRVRRRRCERATRQPTRHTRASLYSRLHV